MTKNSASDKIIDLLTKEIDPITSKTTFDIFLKKIKFKKKPWYTKTQKKRFWERSSLLRLLDNSLSFRIFLSLLIAYLSIFIINYSEKLFNKEYICLSIECFPRQLWSLIKVGNIEGFSVTSAAILYLIESRSRNKKSEYDAWQVIDNASAGGRKKSEARLKAIEELNSRRVSLRNQNFSDIDLESINLNRGNLQGANFHRTGASHFGKSIDSRGVERTTEVKTPERQHLIDIWRVPLCPRQM